VIHAEATVLTSFRHRCTHAAASRFRSASLVACLMLVVGAGMFGCARYQIGNQSLYSTEVHTVYVPIFESASYRRNLGERLTEAVVKEIELRTPYKVVGSPDADSTLLGRISAETKRMTISSPQGEPRQEQMQMVVQVSWINKTGQALRAGATVPVDPAAASVTGAATFVPEFGQSVASAQQTAIQRIAQQIVALMEAPW